MNTYGVGKGASAGDSKMDSGSLLWKVQHPDSSGATGGGTDAHHAQSKATLRRSGESTR